MEIIPVGSKKQRCRRKPKKITELAPSNLSFFITIVRKIGLVRRGGGAHVAFVAQHLLDGFV